MTNETQLLPTRKTTHLLERYSESDLPTERGQFRIVVFRDKRDGREHVAMVKGDLRGLEGVPVRMHSECLTSEVFGSLRCDCRAQLDRALDFISQQGKGVLLYLRQEGRGIGLGNKIRAYALQQEAGLDTVEANLKLGFADDLRRYDVAAEMLRSLGVKSADLITNNPLKIAGLVDEGIPVRRRIPSRTLTNPLNVGYLKTKRDRSGHLIEFLSEEDGSEAKAG
jgi:GTP cyclohydrolase II/3,4-dihydroxy 2-butanone 4-phosphate synthase/GTP cyclohydrolase II